MAEPDDLSEDWRKLRLTKEENDVRIDYDSQMDNIISRQMEYCLINKLLSSRRIVLGIIKNTFANAWRSNLEFNVEGLGRNLFLVKFDTKKDKEMVMRLGPQCFDNFLLALEDPKVNIRLSRLVFDKVAFWIRLLDIPLGFHNKYMAKKVGDAIGKFLEVDSDEDIFVGERV